MNCLEYAQTIYPSLPFEYLKAVCKLYSHNIKTVFLEERYNYYYSRNKKVNLPYKDLPYIFDEEILTKGNYIELILKNPLWNEFNIVPYLKNIDTIELPFVKYPLYFPYLPEGVYIDEFVVYIEVEEVFSFNKSQVSLFKMIKNLLDYKGTFLILSLPISIYREIFQFQQVKEFLFKETFKERKIVYPSNSAFK